MPSNAQATESPPPASVLPLLSALHDLPLHSSLGSVPDHRGTERTGSRPSAQLTGPETIYVSGCHLSPSSQALPVWEPLFCVLGLKELSLQGVGRRLLLNRSDIWGNQGELHGGGDI